MNLSWINFKEKHLFSVNIAIVASFILWQVRRDFIWHPAILAWFVAGFLLPQFRVAERKLMLALGKVNGLIILSVFYFLIFTPFSFFYRWFFRHHSFRKMSSTFDHKTSISPFDRPF